MNDIEQKINKINGQQIAEEMDEKGYILLSQFLPVKYCKELIDNYGNEDLYRKIINMEKYRFGLGEYKYFKYPLPNIANNWMRLLNLKRQFPNDFETLQKICHDNNQTECTVLILRYGKGGFNTLHQDLYGNIFFPIQLVLFLNEPDEDYSGGEFVLTQQNPRAQSKAIVLRPRIGDMLILTTNFRPMKGNKGYYQVQMRHGISEVHEGERHTLGIIFHDALH
ncbi:MAG: prolyl 4-hydroxylase subunit alpha [Thaumarchaeota archaeon]|nr:MAG: prolyl 4-hydroxylase subunit alpha [Nitrososphaerota archaeon]